MRRLLALLVAAALHGGPITEFHTNHSALLPPGTSISAPGLLPDHPGLYTFSHTDDPSPDYAHCGQRGFIPTLENGAPDPNGIPSYMQINTPCAAQFAGIGEVHGSEPNKPEHHHPPETAVPEPDTFWLVVLAFLAVLGYFAVRRRP